MIKSLWQELCAYISYSRVLRKHCQFLDELIEKTRTKTLVWTPAAPARAGYSMQLYEMDVLVSTIIFQMDHSTGNLMFSMNDERPDSYTLYVFKTEEPRLSKKIARRLFVLHDTISGGIPVYTPTRRRLTL